MEYHLLTKRITGLLTQHNCWFETFEHEPVTTSEEAALVRTGYTLHQGAKAIIVKISPKSGEEKFIMIVLPADLRLDSKKIKVSLNLKSFRFATEEEISSLEPGLLRGAIPPFGNLISLPVYADRSLFGIEKIVFNAGDRRFSVAVKSEDYRKLVEPKILDISV